MKKRNLTKGNVTAVMLLFAVPMILGNIMQQCYNLADTWIVGCRKRIYAYDVFKFDPDRHVYGERSAFFNLLWPKSVKKTKRIYCFIVCAYFFSDSDFDDCFICVP